MSQEKTIWDFPTRLFHWSLVLSVAGGILTGFFAPDEWIMAHVWFGTAALALIIFRLIWGIAGSYYSRFSTFTFSLAETRAYALNFLAKNPIHYLGHNPLGALMIFALIGSLLIITLTGYGVLAGEENLGPLVGIVGRTMGNFFEGIHEALTNFLLFLIGGHLLGIIIESLRSGENLPRTMITGRKRAAAALPIVHRGLSLFGTLGLVIIVVSALYWVAGF